MTSPFAEDLLFSVSALEGKTTDKKVDMYNEISGK
jgi:hypothetical protein